MFGMNCQPSKFAKLVSYPITTMQLLHHCHIKSTKAFVSKLPLWWNSTITVYSLGPDDNSKKDMTCLWPIPAFWNFFQSALRFELRSLGCETITLTSVPLPSHPAEWHLTFSFQDELDTIALIGIETGTGTENRTNRFVAKVRPTSFSFYRTHKRQVPETRCLVLLSLFYQF